MVKCAIYSIDNIAKWGDINTYHTRELLLQVVHLFFCQRPIQFFYQFFKLLGVNQKLLDLLDVFLKFFNIVFHGM